MVVAAGIGGYGFSGLYIPHDALVLECAILSPLVTLIAFGAWGLAGIAHHAPILRSRGYFRRRNPRADTLGSMLGLAALSVLSLRPVAHQINHNDARALAVFYLLWAGMISFVPFIYWASAAWVPAPGSSSTTDQVLAP